jgi:hypothetical protein
MTMAEKKAPAAAAISSGGDTTPHGDHTAADLADSYSEAKDKPSPESVAQEQEPPANWPGTVRNAP